ncbi:NRDE family protein [Marinifilum caeruleilacunae]|uniref:NRDE family protein n=1 Tax=Marinifilum caeruleilacunae TaxID=2499076 RepID=A0ABX1WSG9_9BACT|nr:NRDE family protein [Marinifilum caeruleilacunae]NOU58971.1 hypothetical protein [Marinifilum caeruleilacunae]
MCTLTYIPTGEDHFIFTTNRDEDPKRIALPPCIYKTKLLENLYPLDQSGNGTWMLCNANYSLCLLNGAFVKHKHQPPYKKSRGQVVLDYENYTDSTKFVLNYSFKGIEPFTMVVVRHTDGNKLEEIRWDGESIHYKALQNEIPAIWSSSTLYDTAAKDLRVKWFKSWKAENTFTPSTVLNFHKSAGKGDTTNGLIMNRKEIVKTTSITQIVSDKSGLSMRYEDLKDDKVYQKSL